MDFFCRLLIILFTELVSNMIFFLITPETETPGKWDFKSLIKGFIERGFLTYSLYSGFPHALTLFGALKLGTRLKKADNEFTEEGRRKESIYNDYYLMGNLISVSLSIFYYNILK